MRPYRAASSAGAGFRTLPTVALARRATAGVPPLYPLFPHGIGPKRE